MLEAVGEIASFKQGFQLKGRAVASYLALHKSAEGALKMMTTGSIRPEKRKTEETEIKCKWSYLRV